MTVLFLTHYSALYGANLAMLDLAEDLIKMYGVKVTILCPYKGELEKRARSMGIEVICCRHIPWQANKQFLVRKVFRIFLNPILTRIILLKIRRIQPDVIHSNSSLVDLGVKLALRLNRPCVWHLREYGEKDYNLKYLIKNDKIEVIYNQATALVAISESVKNDYIKRFSSLKIDVIYDGLKPFIVHKKEHKGINFCCIGRICEGKGQMELLKATKVLHRRHGGIFKVFLVGDGEKEYMKEVYDYVNENNLNDVVVLCGYVNQIKKILETMDVGVMSSKCEAFGRVTVEYMYANMCVIATDSGGNYELLGNAGLYYKSGDYYGLAKIMENCIMGEISIEKYRNELNKIAHSRFCQRINTEKIFETYSRVIK